VLVVDTSAVIGALVGRPPDRQLLDRLGIDGDLCAPHLLDVELLHALHRLVIGGQLSEDRAADAVTTSPTSPSSATTTSPWPTAPGSCGTA
jgi:predicted nucleic acid-binding protein